MSIRVPDRITLERADDGWWVAWDEETDIASQGPTREEALDNLDEALEGAATALEEGGDASVPDAPWFDN
jgi:predicted RNase H-like HicB family nuclease